MYVGEFAPADSAESELYGFDFKRDLAPGETITAVTFALSVIEGTDATPTARLVGSPLIAGTQVKQRIAGLVPSVTYGVEAVVSTNQANSRSLWGRVACRS